MVSNNGETNKSENKKDNEINNEKNNVNENLNKEIQTDNDKNKQENPETKTEKENYKEKYNELKEQLLRNIAEFDNYKKRTRNEIDNAKNIGKAELLKNMLPIIDEFDLTLLAVSESQEKNLSRGIELLYSNFITELKKTGLEEIKSDGIFDPYKHEILMVKENPKPYGVILETIKKGYMFNEIMLRPASVIISKGQEQKENK